MIGRAAIDYPWILMKSNIILILENIWLNPVVVDRVEAVRNHLGVEWKGERLGL
jgi:hypothetical protein